MAGEVGYTTFPAHYVVPADPRCQQRTSLINRDDQKLSLLAPELGLVPDVVVSRALGRELSTATWSHHTSWYGDGLSVEAGDDVRRCLA